MSIVAALGLICIVLAILGLVSVIATTVVVEVILAVLGLLLLAYSTGRLRL